MSLTLYYSSLLFIFAIVAYIIIIDPNVGKFILLLLQLAKVNINRFIFLMRFYPRLWLDSKIMRWKSSRILKKSKLNDP